MAARSIAWEAGMLTFISLATFLVADAIAVNEGLLSKGVMNADQPGSFSITNVMDIGGGVNVSAHCHTAQTDLAFTVITTGLIYTIDFQFDPMINVPYICEFGWLGGTNSQSFAVWTHDGTPYLSVCDQCLWKVENDGFYILNTANSLYYKMYSWSTGNI